mgnify:FL=1
MAANARRQFGRGKLSKKNKAVLAALRRSSRTRSKKSGNGNTGYSAGIAQGAGYTSKKPFGSVLPKQCSDHDLQCCFNAFMPHHLPLPRAVGPYTTVRVTSRHSLTEQFGLFGPMHNYDMSGFPGREWVDTVGISFGVTSMQNAISSGDNARVFTRSMGRGWDNASIVPSAFSIQVMNPQPMQTAQGMFYIGRLGYVPNLVGDLRTVEEFKNECIAYFAPRLCSGGKLVMRGIQADCLPFNMNEMADFENWRKMQSNASTITYREPTTPAEPGLQTFGAMAPIFIATDGNISAERPLELLICQEYRVRFDPTNPAAAAHTMKPVASDHTWYRAASLGVKLGNGVVDINAKVAAAGSAMGSLNIKGEL